jgi:hypothetical protein
MTTHAIFPGNCPHNVSKDAKYTVRGTDGRIALEYCVDDVTRWHLSTKAHPELAAMVNAVKRTFGSGPNGPFYVNEYKQVIVPVGPAATYYYAGNYDQPIRFERDGKTISGEPIDPEGKPMQPGQTWHGPHAGIPYVLTAAGDDVYYRTFPQPDVERRVKLSRERGKGIAQQIARLLSAFKGAGGGRFYVNEFRVVFSPINSDDGLAYIYIGQIDLDSWFTDPLASVIPA